MRSGRSVGLEWRLRLYDYHTDFGTHVEGDSGEIGARCFADGPLALRRAGRNGKLDRDLCITAGWTAAATSQGGLCCRDGGSERLGRKSGGGRAGTPFTAYRDAEGVESRAADGGRRSVGGGGRGGG